MQARDVVYMGYEKIRVEASWPVGVRSGEKWTRMIGVNYFAVML